MAAVPPPASVTTFQKTARFGAPECETVGAVIEGLQP
jgi:hypothetical protein